MKDNLNVRAIFEDVLPTKIQDFELRSSQLKMAELVEDVFNKGGKALVEAGTGTGKSLAYLLPALLSKNSRIAISTGTKNLQEQLFKKDIPFLHELWQETFGEEFSYIYIQGRSNYLCLARLYNTLLPNDEKAILRKWADESELGNLNELRGQISAETIKNVASDPDYCLGLHCSYKGECFVSRLRAKAERCQILVVNHHLLLTDLLIKDAIDNDQGSILPPLTHIVIDEAHHLEDVASACFGTEVYFESLYAIRHQVINSRSLQRENIDLKSKIEAELDQALPQINAAVRLVRKIETDELERLEINGELSVVAQNIKLHYQEIAKLLSDYEEDVVDAIALARKASRVVGGIDAFLDVSEERVSFANRDGFRSIPLKVSDILQRVLFEPHDSVVLTSATLSTSGNFQYIKSSLGLVESIELSLPSPFDFNKVLLAIPTDLINPNSDEYTQKIADHLQNILPLISGGSFVLCTSFKQVKAFKEALSDIPDINLYIHGERNAQELITSFKEDGRGVLIGVDSFWEGVDVPGEALKAVFITKMPFPVPTEPLFEAKKNLVEQRGGNSFRELSLPIALLKLRQGFGRLIRRQSDNGLVVIYDSRVLYKSYGRDVLNSLPKCSEWRGQLNEMATYIKKESKWSKRLFR